MDTTAGIPAPVPTREVPQAPCSNRRQPPPPPSVSPVFQQTSTPVSHRSVPEISFAPALPPPPPPPLNVTHVMPEDKATSNSAFVKQQPPSIDNRSALLDQIKKEAQSLSTQSLANGKEAKKDKKKKKKLTRDDMCTPITFTRVQHVKWDPKKGFDIENMDDEDLKAFFTFAGVSGTPPPVPTRELPQTPRSHRRLPPPPPSVSPVLQQICTPVSQSEISAAPLRRQPPPPPVGDSVPPPPSSPSPPLNVMPEADATSNSAFVKQQPPPIDNRSALLD